MDGFSRILAVYLVVAIDSLNCLPKAKHCHFDSFILGPVGSAFEEGVC
jgi:hypothetical protein